MKSFSLLLAFGVALTLTACSNDEPAVQPAAKAAPVAVQQTTENVQQVAKQVEEQTQAAVVQVKGGLDSGQVIYAKSCASCHKPGLLGAPKTGDNKAWSALIAGGQEKLVNNAINGIGRMPAKGGASRLSDEEVAAAVDYMVEQSR